jgi:hypothetical protein
MRWAGQRHIWETGNMHTGVWWKNLREREHLENVGINGTIIISNTFKNLDAEAWSGLIRLRRGTHGGLL